MGGDTSRHVAVDLTAVIVAVTREVPRVLGVPDLVRGTWADGLATRPASGADPLVDAVASGADPLVDAVASGADPQVDALPSGPLEPGVDRTLELAVRRWVRDVSGLELGYVEQLYTFGDRFRDPIERHGGPRRISVAYLALVCEQGTAEPMRARWRDVYDYLPWEDWRGGRPSAIADTIEPVLRRWIESAPRAWERQARLDRADIAFGRGGAPWDVNRVLDRYELLYELQVVGEAVGDLGDRSAAIAASPGQAAGTGTEPAAGRPMVLDHRRILATALARLRGKLRYRPLVFELLPPTFTITHLLRVVESLAGVRLHQANFRRLLDTGGLVEGTGRLDTRTGGRPAELYRFRREVLREHPSAGVGLPGFPG